MPVNIKGIPWDKTRKRDGLPPGIHRSKRYPKQEEYITTISPRPSIRMIINIG